MSMAISQVQVIDCSNYTGEITSIIAACLYTSGVRHAIVRCSLETAAKTALAQRQMAAFIAAGIKVHGYLWTYSTDNPSSMARQTMLMFGGLIGDGYYFLDIEDVASWAGVLPANAVAWHQAAMDTLISSGKRAGIYSADWCWEPIMGGSTQFSQYVLWNADYDHVASTLVFTPFGGWTHCEGKQYGDSSSCAPAIDLDTFNAGVLLSPVVTAPADAPDVSDAQDELNLLDAAIDQIDAAVINLKTYSSGARADLNT